VIELHVHYAGHDWTLVSAVVLPLVSQLGGIGHGTVTQCSAVAPPCSLRTTIIPYRVAEADAQGRVEI